MPAGRAGGEHLGMQFHRGGSKLGMPQDITEMQAVDAQNVSGDPPSRLALGTRMRVKETRLQSSRIPNLIPSSP